MWGMGIQEERKILGPRDRQGQVTSAILLLYDILGAFMSQESALSLGIR
jgi:hypothetical protein